MKKLIGLLFLVLATTGASAKMFKWVDEDGRIHYSDRIPPNETQRGHSTLNKQGLIVDRTKAALTPEELARINELERLRKEQKALKEVQVAKDEVLLRTFRAEDDILLARNGKLTAIDNMIQISQANTNRLKRNLVNMQSTAASMERQGESIPSSLTKQIVHNKELIEEDYANILKREEDKATIQGKYDKDLTRFRQLKRLHEDKPIPKPKSRVASLVETVVVCGEGINCPDLWQRAKAYVKKHSTKKIRMQTDRLYLADLPIRVDDVSLTVSRIAPQDNWPERIFMDVQCLNSTAGRAFCGEKTVMQLRKNFRPFVLNK